MTKAVNHDRRQFLRSAAMTIGASQFALTGAKAASLFGGGSLPPLTGATGWLNSAPLTKENLRGKVVLIDFWTYTCINWRRTFPYVRAWNEKYGKDGLVVVGVHTPEFAFEQDIENVRQAVKEIGIKYPIAVDSEYAVWRAFENEYWPAIYLADAQGHIRYHTFGEGEYVQSEDVIQRLLNQAGSMGIDSHPISIEATGAEAAPDWRDMQSEENYLGHERTENFASDGGFVSGQSRTYTSPARLKLNQWALAGHWAVQERGIVLDGLNGHIAYQFHARDLHLVMGPAARGTSVRFRVLIDGMPPGVAHGVDVNDVGNGIVTEPRMYQLIRQPQPIIDRRFDIEFLDPGLEAFSFTFG